MGLGQVTTRRQSVVEAHSRFNVNMYDRIKLLYPRSKRREQTTAKKCHISKLYKRSSKSKQNTAKVQVKNSNITKDILVERNNCNKKSLGFSLKKVYISVSKIKLPENLIKCKKPKVSSKTHRKLNLNSSNIETYKRKQSTIHLKLHPKTVKDFQNNDKLLASFNSGHSDDMFENRKAPNRVVSQMILDDSFSDVDSSPGARSKTPVTNYVSSFGGWSQETPASLRMEDEETSETPGQFKRCAFLQNAIREKNSKKLFPKSAVAKSSTHGFNSCLSQLKPALEETDRALLSDSEDEKEPYFEDA